MAFVSHWDWVLYNYRLPLARSLREHGCDIVFICPRGRYHDAFRTEGFETVHWRVNRRSINPVRELASLSHLILLLRRLRPHVVQNFTIKPNLYGSIGARIARVPWVINTFSGLGYLYSGRALAGALRTALRPLLREAFTAPNVFSVFQTREDRDHLAGRRLVSSDRTVVVSGSGVDLQLFSPPGGKNGDSSRPPIVLMVSRLLWDKGISEFVAAARSLRAGGAAAEFRLAGASDDGNRASVPATTLARWNADGAVRFLGHREDVPDLLREADIAVLPSYREGIPRFLLEAAAAGLPLVATDINGCREIVRDGVNGFLVPPGDHVELAAAISRLLSDRELRTRLGEESRRVAEEAFSLDKVVGQYLQVYRRIGVVR